jgi:hypothetical protein
MPQMWQRQKPACLWQFLRQNFEKKLGLLQDLKGAAQPFDNFRPLRKGGRLIGLGIFILSAFLFHCIPTADRGQVSDAAGEPEKAIQVFEADEKVVRRAVIRVLKDRGFGDSKVEADRGRLETDYMVQSDWRTRVVATIKKISRNETEVALAVITEKKSSSGWQPKQLMGREQYDKFFREIEMQIYREWYKGE